MGQKIGCFATTEPDASSELSSRSVSTKAEKRGNKYIVNGRKRFITNAVVADLVCALVKIDGKLSMLVVDLDSSGCKIGEPDKKWEIEANSLPIFILIMWKSLWKT